MSRAPALPTVLAVSRPVAVEQPDHRGPDTFSMPSARSRPPPRGSRSTSSGWPPRLAEAQATEAANVDAPAPAPATEDTDDGGGAGGGGLGGVGQRGDQEFVVSGECDDPVHAQQHRRAPVPFGQRTGRNRENSPSPPEACLGHSDGGADQAPERQRPLERFPCGSHGPEQDGLGVPGVG
ncbi:hypothetical protein [Actinoalloteichus caeruleus]|uniref:Uncharacterized protein n=1 Tax=Actinoalloteichus caeruleus DSM 43889 TaxID=1120930 RepID=A0ABT1JB93_ACTCY|nr:hypothetical protein [Actinoalloteichus caeruleus DSM 43889]